MGKEILQKHIYLQLKNIKKMNFSPRFKIKNAHAQREGCYYNNLWRMKHLRPHETDYLSENNRLAKRFINDNVLVRRQSYMIPRDHNMILQILLGLHSTEQVHLRRTFFWIMNPSHQLSEMNFAENAVNHRFSNNTSPQHKLLMDFDLVLEQGDCLL